MSGGAPAPDNYASNKQAAISREMYDYAKKNFHPLEAQLVSEMNDTALIPRAVNKMRGITSEALNATDNAQQREAGRYGIQMTAGRTKANNRANNLNRGLAMVSNSNSTRRGVDTYKTKVINSIASIGRGTAGQAMTGFGTAAGLAQGRNNANRNAKAQQDSQNMQMAGTAASIAAMAIFT